MMHIISLGAGVQSSTMALMAAHGEIGPMPDAAIFADTQAEPKEVMDWLDWLEKQLPFPVIRVTNGSLSEASLEIRNSSNTGKNYLRCLIPAFLLAPDGSKGLLGRKCTSDYKIQPLIRHLREMLGMKQIRGNEILVHQWIGISTDEGQRMKPSRDKWINHRWPLIEQNMTRGHCLEWMKKNYSNNIPPRSACSFCPFHSDTEWQRIKELPGEFAKVIKFERELQDAATRCEVTRGVPYLHPSCKPIEEVDFTYGDGKQQVDMFGNECEGMCGV